MNVEFSLIILESAKKTKTLSSILGKGYITMACYGHVRNLPSRTKSVMPEKGFEAVWETKEDRVKKIIAAAKKSSKVILATDPDREGEAIGYHIANILKENKVNVPISRIKFRSLERNAILSSIKEEKEIDTNLVDSYLARLFLDYLVGFNISPVLWRKIPGNKSAGRVQSVALKIIVNREREIELFKAHKYWVVEAVDNKDVKFSPKAWDGEKEIRSQEQAENIRKIIEESKWRVADIVEKETKQHPPAPFTTATLQQTASNLLGFRPSKTMKLAQELYEGVKIGNELTGLITYMRTDSTNVHPDAIEQCRKVVEEKYGKDHLSSKARFFIQKKKNAQEAHEAIRPAVYTIHPETVREYAGKDLAMLYKVIWERAIGSQMQYAILLNTCVVAKSGNHEIVAKGKKYKSMGYKVLSKKDQEELLPEYEIGEEVNVKKTAITEHETQPPKRYSEAGIIKELEKQGIGRPSTFDKIITTLQTRGYVKRENKALIPEDRGWIVTGFLEEWFAKYVSVEFTSSMEDGLDLIANGKRHWKDQLQEFWKEFKKFVLNASIITPSQVQEALKKNVGRYLIKEEGCPKCMQGDQIVKYSKNGGFIGCDKYPDCNWIRPLTKNNIVIHEDEVDRVVLKNGPYGRYAYWERQDKKIIIPRNVTDEKVTWELISQWKDLPKTVGYYGEEKISIGIGQYGPYVKREGGKIEYRSIPGSVKIETLDLESSIEILNRPKKIRKKVETAEKSVKRKKVETAEKSVKRKKVETAEKSVK